MFEGKFNHAGLSDDTLGTANEEPLRDLSWADLAARLAAARDLRRALDASQTEGDGSFLAAMGQRLSAGEQGKPSVNPISLASGKAADGNNADDPQTARGGS